MSVTVVSTLNKPVSVSPTDSDQGKSVSDDGTAGGQNFADLLLGQLVASSAKTVDSGDLTGAVAADDEPAEGTDTEALFATLGLAGQDSIRASDTRPAAQTSLLAGIAPNDRATAEASNALESMTGREQTALQTTDDKSAAKSDSFSLIKPVADDKSAIIAAKSAAASAAADSLAAQRLMSTSETSATRTVANEALAGNLPAAARETSLSVATPVRDAAWTSEIADKIVWLATNDKQSAKLTLNPAHMGPLEISLNIDKGHATASFVSANAEVRDALETALPRLREMFANAGISLGQTNVSAESFNQQAGNGDRGAQTPGSARWSADNVILVGDSASSAVSMSLSAFAARSGNGMVDTFA